VQAAAAAAQLEPGEGDHVDACFVQVGGGPGIALLGDHHLGAEGGDVVAVVPLLALWSVQGVEVSPRCALPPPCPRLHAATGRRLTN
jgi:hypothetical protein